MKISELQKKVADVLGVSASQKELSFEIFVDTITEILDQGITLKVPRIGFFQLQQNKSKSDPEKILFSPLPEDYSHDMRSLYLTIDITPKSKNTLEFDSHIFSIGVGKPLLPLTSDEQPDSETSFAMLKKSIEERVRELISESDQIPNFNIWDDYYKSPEEFDGDSFNQTKSRFNELTSDLDFKEITIPPGIPKNFFDEYTSERESGHGIESADGKTEVSKEDNYWPDIEKEKLIDFDEIQTRSEQETDASSIEKLLEDEAASEYSKTENKQPEDDKNSSLTLANLLYDLPKENKEIEFTEVDAQQPAVEQYFKDEEVEKAEEPAEEEITALQEPEVIETTVAEIYPEDTVQPEEEVKADENEMTEMKAESSEETAADEMPAETTEAQTIEPQEEAAWVGIIDESNVETGVPEIVKTEEEKEPGLEEEIIPAGPIIEEGQEKKEEQQQEEEITEAPETKEIDEKLPEPEEIDVPIISYKFAELEKIIEDGKAELGKDDDSVPDEDRLQSNEERIEWNWGDDLREEFGIKKGIMFEEHQAEPVPEPESHDDDLELVDEPIETDNRFTKDLFKDLEKTLEREKLFDDFASRKRPTIVEFPKSSESNKKVFLEFSGPPSRYEFVEDRRNERDKRMAISLVEEDDRHFTTSTSNRLIPEKEPAEKERYFGKTILVIISAFVIVTATIIFFVLRPNNKEVQQSNQGQNQQKEAGAIQENQPESSSITQSQIKTETGNQNKSTSAIPLNDELSDFPISATPPVPIKSGSAGKDAEVNKTKAPVKEAAKTAEKPAAKTTAPASKNDANETRIGKSIYTDGKTFNYQTSSWKNKQKAELEIKRLKGLGLNAYIVQVNLPQKGGIWFRVRVGSFRTQQEAENSMRQNNFQE